MRSLAMQPGYGNSSSFGSHENLLPRQFGNLGVSTVHLIGRRSTLVPVDLPYSREHHRLVLTLQGSAGLSLASGSALFLAPRSLVFLPSGLDVDMILGREDHECLIVSVGIDRLEALGIASLSTEAFAFHLDQQAAPLTFVVNAMQRLLMKSGVDEQELTALVVAGLSLALHYRRVDSAPETLADIPLESHDVLVTLLRAVRDDPSRAWGLKEAAESASYSAFHLSRTFRNLADYGFPEFVDRCRAEAACRMLLRTTKTYEEVFIECGFGSSQGMRASLREYYGFLPSEIRGLVKP